MSNVITENVDFEVTPPLIPGMGGHIRAYLEINGYASISDKAWEEVAIQHSKELLKNQLSHIVYGKVAHEMERLLYCLSRFVRSAYPLNMTPGGEEMYTEIQEAASRIREYMKP